jgi:L-ascorbate metabolism protein UlaG (beta-lactamase superfamily)
MLKEDAVTANSGVTITWLGHATTLIDTPDGKRILIDPWLSQNPATPDDRKQLDRLDLMLITHGHFDHMGDAVSVATATEPDVIANFEIAAWLQGKGVGKTNGMAHGGTVTWNGIAITLVEAVHGSGISDGGSIVYGGTAGGFVIRFANDFTLYHAGDTDVFASMKLIRELHHPNVAMLPIGGHFTMDPVRAAAALRMLEVSAVIPIHHGTFPLLTGTPAQLEEATRDISGLKVVGLKPGQSLNQSDLV